MKYFKIYTLALFLVAFFAWPCKAEAFFLAYVKTYFQDTYHEVQSSVHECVEFFTLNPHKQIYKADNIKVSHNSTPQPGEKIQIQVSMENAGNAIWLGDKTLCPVKNFMRLGTVKDTDHTSRFYTELPDKTDVSWLSGNRIAMEESMVHPGETATFLFDTVAPTQSGIYIEYFSPVIENTLWLPESEIKIQLDVGQITQEDLDKIFFMQKSSYSRDIDLSTRNIIIDISDQKLHARLEEETIFTFPISSGTYKTPTPLGKTQVYFKQPLRVSGKSPHYIMPYYQAFRHSGAYGVHALPSLANDKGVYWHEALTHIGQRRSHGCVRLLPEDAVRLWKFSDVGTPVEVQY